MSNRGLYGSSFHSGNALSAGFLCNALLEFNLNGKTYFTSGLSFERKGQSDEISFRNESAELLGTSNVYFNLDYLVLPLNFGYRFGNNNMFKIYGGPYAATIISQRIKSNNDFGFEYDTDISDAYKPFDFGVNAGCGIIFPINQKTSFNMNLNHNLGLIYIHKSNSAETKTYSTSLTLGLSYSLNKESN